VIPADQLLLLDSNVLLHLTRGRTAGLWIAERYGLHARQEKPLISVVSTGEMWRLAERRGWGEAQRARLEEMGTQMVVVPLEPLVVRNYGRMGAYLDARGTPIPQNDLWIAATASAMRAILLTTDRHFDSLAEGGWVTREYLDPDRLPR
jgi:tRNA(fMet)-specific endonuclease VapC